MPIRTLSIDWKYMESIKFSRCIEHRKSSSFISFVGKYNSSHQLNMCATSSAVSLIFISQCSLSVSLYHSVCQLTPFSRFVVVLVFVDLYAALPIDSTPYSHSWNCNRHSLALWSTSNMSNLLNTDKNNSSFNVKCLEFQRRD